jgi:hypothetical protein
MSFKIPLKHKLKWFLRGMLNLFGNYYTPEKRARDLKECVEEMLAQKVSPD